MQKLPESRWQDLGNSKDAKRELSIVSQEFDFCFTSLSIVLCLLFEPLHSDLFKFLYRHLHRRTICYAFYSPLSAACRRAKNASLSV